MTYNLTDGGVSMRATVAHGCSGGGGGESMAEGAVQRASPLFPLLFRAPPAPVQHEPA